MVILVSAWYYVAIILGFTALMAASIVNLTNLAEKECPLCHKKFGDVFSLRRHIKTVFEAG